MRSRVKALSSLDGSAFISAPGLALKQWGGDDCAVLFDPRLATTHLVSADAATLLRAASGGAVTATLLAEALFAGELGPSSPERALPDELQRYLLASVEGLVAQGLLQRVPCPAC